MGGNPPQVPLPPSDLAGGVPNRGYPTSGTPPVRPGRVGVPRRGGGGYPISSSTWYAAVGMPLAFTQEDFLVLYCFYSFFKSYNFNNSVEKYVWFDVDLQAKIECGNFCKHNQLFFVNAVCIVDYYSIMWLMCEPITFREWLFTQRKLWRMPRRPLGRVTRKIMQRL